MIPYLLAAIAASVGFAYYMLVMRNKDEALDGWSKTWERRRKNTRGSSDGPELREEDDR